MGEFVRLEVEDGVGTIRLDRPKMNALNVQVQEEIRAPPPRRPTRDDVRAVVVYGGERVFAAGADVKEMADMSYTDMVARSGGLQSAFTAVARIPKPVVAAVTGYALGGGCELALCADVRIAGEGATLGQPEILLGIIPGAGGTQRLTRLVGPAQGEGHHLHRPVRRGRGGAARSGWSTRWSPDDQVYAAALDLGPAVRRRAARSRCGRPRRRSTAASRWTWTPGLEIERIQFAALFATEDRQRDAVVRRERPRARRRSPGADRSDRSGTLRWVEPRCSRYGAANAPEEFVVTLSNRKQLREQPREKQGSDRSAVDRLVDGTNTVRSSIASIVWSIAFLCAAVLAVAALMVALEADNANAVVSFVKDTARTLDLGVLSPGDGSFTPTHDPELVRAALVNWGLAAVLYLVAGKFADRIIRP